jgi:hypothetical protein
MKELPDRLNIEMSKFLDKAGDAMPRSGSFAQPYLQISSTAMTADGNCEMCQFIKYIPGPIGKADIFSNLNFGVISKNVTLTNDWQRYQLSLNGIDFKGVTNQFGFIVSKVRTQRHVPSSISLYPLDDANANHIVFFLKGVTIDNMPAINPLPTVQLSSTNATTKS